MALIDYEGQGHILRTVFIMDKLYCMMTALVSFLW